MLETVKREMFMNIQEFAKICGCSRGTVTNAFSAPEKLRPETLRKIRELAEARGFRPNRVAAGLGSRNNRTHVIGVLNYRPDLIRYFRDISSGIQQALLPNDYLPLGIELEWSDRLALLRRLVDQRVDGIILVNVRSDLTPEELREVDPRGIPLVFIDSRTGDGEDWVVTDEPGGGRLAAENLLAGGARRIHFFTGVQRRYFHPPIPPYGNRPFRSDAFWEVMTANGITPGISCCEDDWDAVFARPDYPDGVFLASDVNVRRVYRAIRRAGLSVPRDIQVVGYSDMEIAEWAVPPLSTIHQDGFAVGRAAAETMLARLRDRALPPLHTVLPVTWVERESTRPRTPNNTRIYNKTGE